MGLLPIKETEGKYEKKGACTNGFLGELSPGPERRGP
jgi:hypothetical protein